MEYFLYAKNEIIIEKRKGDVLYRTMENYNRSKEL